MSDVDSGAKAEFDVGALAQPDPRPPRRVEFLVPSSCGGGFHVVYVEPFTIAFGDPAHVAADINASDGTFVQMRVIR